MLALSDGLRARQFPPVNVAIVAANFAVWLVHEQPHLNSAVFHASFHTRARRVEPQDHAHVFGGAPA